MTASSLALRFEFGSRIAHLRIGNDKRRYQRQQHTFRAGEDEIILDASGQPLPPPDEDPLIPQLPVGFPVCHKPRLWIPPPRIGAPKREREGEASSSDEAKDKREREGPRYQASRLRDGQR